MPLNREDFSNLRAHFLTLIRAAPRGFFVPYPYAAQIPKSVPPYPAVEELFASRQDNFREILTAFSDVLSDYEASLQDGAIFWEDASMFPKVDTLVAYTIVRKARPKRILEVGSGASSHVLARGLSDNGHGTLTCIDPAPRRAIHATGAKFHRRLLNEDDGQLLADFEPNDILFIDSSHVMLQGMDVDIQFNRMFPLLPEGAIVHVHDIFLPDSYPGPWFRRFYSEQNALIGWILSGFFEIVFPGYYVVTRMEVELRDAMGPLCPDDPRRNSGSIWLRRTASAGQTG